ncbi:hypothetical protein K3X13_00370 [Aliiroseovarius crassostreae]|uniref:SCP domain-containing protein n=1 Tax=Aliiroseovarius crassostreae TaxID=154981 RepID=A0A9Q9LTR1_9RHOB|nr:CAP domain-containing protein [Aliiroseovarius crassostreae]UWP92360.1 hypothetical protein K3X13_00370 [Aliiroseovarius crassostreae]UWP95505.1 hypothetical protein K3X48_00370 [Aliiroseovarius crassostreae]UWP98674.1 hypothetical protein K3X53_00405 [Aliiroseovarius crassostreae]
MLKSTFLAIALLAGAAASAEAGCRLQQVSGANAPLPAKNINRALLNAAVIAQSNYARCKNGLPPLKSVSGMSKQAVAHSKWMAKSRKLTHKGRTTLMARLKGSGVRFKTGAENIGLFSLYRIDGVMTRDIDLSQCRIAYMDGTPVPRHSYASLAKLAVESWMASSKHRKNLLMRKAHMVGNGSGVDLKAARCGKVYLTQIFAG